MKYFVGVRAKDCVIFRSNQRPTSENHPNGVEFAWGPYPSRLRAEQTAMYQNYRIAIPAHYGDAVPVWPGGIE